MYIYTCICRTRRSSRQMASQQTDENLHLIQEQNEEEMEVDKAAHDLFQPTENHLIQDIELTSFNTAIYPLEEPIKVNGIYFTKYALISGEGVELPLLYCNEKSPQKFLMQVQNEEPMEVDRATKTMMRQPEELRAEFTLNKDPM